jgi:hypothetical protein
MNEAEKKLGLGTVKKPESHSESIGCPHCGEEFGIEDKVEYEREVQALSTCPIAKEAGRQEAFKEVGEWLEKSYKDSMDLTEFGERVNLAIPRFKQGKLEE